MMGDRGETAVDKLDLDVRAGEIVGIAGVSGNGQRELLYALSGEDTRAKAGMIEVSGQPVGRMDPRQRRELGVHFVPEERLGRGAVPTLSLAHNLLLTRTAIGRAMRAVSENQQLAALAGVDVRQTIRVVWLLGAALAAVAGVMADRKSVV